MRYLRIVISLTAILIVTVFLSACVKRSSNNTFIPNLDDYSLYSKVVEEILPTFNIGQSDNKPYYLLDDGAVVEAFDVQALGGIETGIAKYWYPQYLATVIIAVDRDQTDAIISSWSDLPSTQEEVGFFDMPGNVQMLTAAMSYGLEGKDFSLIKAIELLTLLHDSNNLKMNSFEAPIIICYDHQAVNLIENGRNIEIIVPKEGTLTYKKGLLSNEKLNFEGDVDKLLYEYKMRLLDGESDLTLYPDEIAYGPSVLINDYKHFAKVTRNTSCLIQRDLLNFKRFMSIDNREHLHFALIYIIIITIWSASIFRRSMQKGISYAAFFTGIILNGWTLVRLIKYQIEGIPVLTRYLWYSFYIFQLSLPLVLLWMAWAIDKPEDEIIPPKWLKNMAVLIGVLIILVFTNDFHGLVFQLDLTRWDWDIDYRYGFGYYIILLISMANLITVFVILVHKSMRNPRKKGIVFPLAVLLMFIAYTYGYIIRNPLIYETDLTIITGLFTMLMFESCIRSGLIPVNTRYIDLFTRSPLKMQIINKEGEIALASAYTIPLNKDILDKVLESSPVPILQDDDSLLFANPIPGGYAIWYEDISKLYQLHREIEQSTQMLEEANNMLAEEEKLKRIINEEDAKRQLMEQLEAEIAQSIGRLTMMIEGLPRSEKHSKETTRIALLLCYIKRRCNLFFQEKETNIVGVDELINYIDELSEIGKYSNVQIATINEMTGSISIRHATLFYDFFHAVLDAAVQKSCPYIIQHLGTEQEQVTMGLLPSENMVTFKAEARLIARITDAKGKILTKDLDDTIGISISFPKGGV